mgnify:CR=1 FL=1
MTRNVTCIICPRGCSMIAKVDDKKVSVSGNACPRGEEYATNEGINPVRTVTATVRVANRPDTMVSVKTAAPISKGEMMNITRLGELGKEGVLLLLCESTNAERAGFTPSERTVGSSLERIFAQYEDRRLIIATFSSNVHRVQQIINASARHGRKVAILGRSMVGVIGAAAELGYGSREYELIEL